MMDRIQILGIRGHGRHGVLAHERRDGQEFAVDVTLEVDTREAANHDDLYRTVDYGMLAQRVHAFIIGEPFQLIETLAHRIADDIIGLERVQSVTVSVHKPQAPIVVPFDDVIVSAYRTR